MVKNSDFITVLSELAPEKSKLWVNAFPGDPDTQGLWSGYAYNPDTSDVDSLVNRNTYYSVAALDPDADGEVARRLSFFKRLLVLVADDPDVTKLNGDPSFIIETSPGKHQVGIFIDPDDPLAADLVAVTRLITAMASVGLVPMDLSGNNAVRYCRLPVGTNQNKKYSPPFNHVLKIWNPEVCLSLESAASVFGVDMDEIPEYTHTQGSDAPQNEKLDAAIATILDGSSLHDSINILSSSLVASGLNGGATTNVVRSIVNNSARRLKDPQTWQARYDDIPRIVSGAEKKYKKPEPEDFSSLNSEHLYDLESLKPVEFVIDGFISNKITVIAGPPGVGKTSLLVPLAFHAAHLCDHESEIKPILRRRVIYVTEDADQVERIIYGICKHENLVSPDEGFRYWFRIENARRKKGEDLAEFITNMRSEYSLNLGSEHNNYIVEPLIVLDTSNATIDLDNENDNAEAGKIIADIKSAIGRAAVWLVAHTSKVTSRTEVDQMSARGAGAFEGDANAVAYLLNLDGNRFLTLGKRRFEADYTDIRFESFADSEEVITPWGTKQIVRYRYGIPCVSSASERDAIKESGAEAAKAKTRFNVRSKALEMLANQGDMAKSKLFQAIKGKKSIFNEVIDELVSSGMVTVTKGDRNADILHVINPRPYRTDGS